MGNQRRHRMVRITEALIRKSAEHNEGCIASLVELSLHQRNIDKIEHLDRWAKRLQILYLQGNIISKIENLGRLRELIYLNLCLNNVKKLRNLEGCEALEKLDLTCNFVADPLEVEYLKSNKRLKELYLLGNPMTDVDGWRDFVVATLPQLESIDGTKITRAERIQAVQRLPQLRERLIEEAAARPEEAPDSSSDEDSEEEEEEEEIQQPSQRGKMPEGVKGGSLSDHWASEREKYYNKQFKYVRNSDEEPKQGEIVCVQVDLKEFQSVVAAGNTQTIACIMEGPLGSNAVKNMTGARCTALVRCAVENRAVEMLLGEWVAEFEWHRKSWKMLSLKPRDQVEREAQPKKEKKIPKEQRSENTPEERIALAEESERIQKEKEDPDPKAIKAAKQYEKSEQFKKEIEEAKAAAELEELMAASRPKQRNEGKWVFNLDEDKTSVILEVGVPKFLDTSAIDLNVEPWWIAMEIKGKQFVIHTPREINPDQCKAERSQNSGSLVLTMPFVGEVIKAQHSHEDRQSKVHKQKFEQAPPSNSLRDEDIGQASTIDLCNIVDNAARKDLKLDARNYSLDRAPKPVVQRKAKKPSATWVDNPDVPPLC